MCNALKVILGVKRKTRVVYLFSAWFIQLSPNHGFLGNYYFNCTYDKSIAAHGTWRSTSKTYHPQFPEPDVYKQWAASIYSFFGGLYGIWNPQFCSAHIWSIHCFPDFLGIQLHGKIRHQQRAVVDLQMDWQDMIGHAWWLMLWWHVHARSRRHHKRAYEWVSTYSMLHPTCMGCFMLSAHGWSNRRMADAER